MVDVQIDQKRKILERGKGNRNSRVPAVFQPRCLSSKGTLSQRLHLLFPLHVPCVNEPVRRLCAPSMAVNLQWACIFLFTFKYSIEFITEIFTWSFVVSKAPIISREIITLKVLRQKCNWVKQDFLGLDYFIFR